MPFSDQITTQYVVPINRTNGFADKCASHKGRDCIFYACGRQYSLESGNVATSALLPLVVSLMFMRNSGC
ncbi:hypothetical protein Pan54_10710 [Rubinisphaera italica]|uniref:Uncharacterized protein n=1 Tax=Rubinisphaera italica TaxID=2527969 RepID=A0A5C5XB34_9PLAN|nr:hypothetical protein Pan54_10710 [Rubinisphaera italica]